MKLSRQLFFVSLLTLTLPLAGFQYLRQLDAQLLDTQAEALLNRAASIAIELSTQPEMFADIFPPPEVGGINFFDLLARPQIDGDCNEWQSDSSAQTDLPIWRSLSTEVAYLSGRSGSDYYLCFQIIDAQVQYSASGLTDRGDYLVLHTGQQQFWLLASGEGDFYASYLNPQGELQRDFTLNASWIETPEGYRVEFRVPDYIAMGIMGVEVVDNDSRTLADVGLNARGEPLRYLQRQDGLQSYLQNLESEGLALTTYLLANTGVVVADVFEKQNEIQEPEDWLAKLYAFINTTELAGNIILPDENGFLATGDYEQPSQVEDAPPENLASTNLASTNSAQVLWYQQGNIRIARAYQPLTLGGLRVGTLVLDEPARTLSGINTQALSRLIWYSGFAFLVTSLGLISYALWLSARIKKLSRATAVTVTDSGKTNLDKPLQKEFIASKAKDELGELSRQYADMLQRINGYTEYLQSLSGKLSHEIRTPVAIVRSSLDNLEHAEDAEQQQIYLSRAREGTDRLASILSAMSQSTAIESAIENAERSDFYPAAVLQDLSNAYQQLYLNTPIQLTLEEGIKQIQIKGSADLFAQMLDKLVDNAVDFCTGEIRIELSQADNMLCLVVENDGAGLPEHMSNNLFDSLVSLRSDKDKSKDKETDAEGHHKPHLGLGLFVVKRIVEFHQGQITAENLAEDSGVRFSILLP